MIHMYIYTNIIYGQIFLITRIFNTKNGHVYFHFHAFTAPCGRACPSNSISVYLSIQRNVQKLGLIQRQNGGRGTKAPCFQDVSLCREFLLSPGGLMRLVIARKCMKRSEDCVCLSYYTRLPCLSIRIEKIKKGNSFSFLANNVDNLIVRGKNFQSSRLL